MGQTSDNCRMIIFLTVTAVLYALMHLAAKRAVDNADYSLAFVRDESHRRQR